jgi:two-component system response regulator MprA
LHVPIIVVSDSLNKKEIIQALDAGASDYVKKPFCIAELSARLRAHIREHDMRDDAVLLIGPYHCRSGTRPPREPVGNVQIQLTQKEVMTLRCLYRASGRPVSRQKMLEEVWGWNPTARTHTLEQHIHLLRRKIEPDPACPTVLVNGSSGYSLGYF